MKTLINRSIFYVAIPLLLVFYIVYISLNQFTKSQIEKIGPEFFKLTLSIEAVSISPVSGEGEMRNFTLANPSSYENEFIIKAERTKFKLDISSIASSQIIFKEVVFENPVINFEKGQSSFNIYDLRKVIDRLQDSYKSKIKIENITFKQPVIKVSDSLVKGKDQRYRAGNLVVEKGELSNLNGTKAIIHIYDKLAKAISNTQNEKEESQLHLLTDLKYFKLLLELGADVNLRNENGQSAIFVQNNLDIINLLINENADLNMQDKTGKSILHQVESLEKAALIVSQTEINVNLLDNDGNAALHLAQDPKIVKILLENDAQIDIRNKKGQTSLHTQTELHAKNILMLKEIELKIEKINTQIKESKELKEEEKKLLESELEKLKTEKDEFKKLENQQLDIINQLIENSSDVNAKDNNGDNPRDLAEKLSDLKLAAILKRNGAVSNKTEIQKN